jgi:hypothetical protein
MLSAATTILLLSNGEEKDCILHEGIKYCAEAPPADMPVWAAIFFITLIVAAFVAIGIFVWDVIRNG